VYWAAVRLFGWLFVAQHRLKRRNRGTKHALAARPWARPAYDASGNLHAW